MRAQGISRRGLMTAVPGPPDPMLPDRADLGVPAPRPRAVLKAVAVTAAALGAAAATYWIVPHGPAAPLHADAPWPGTAGMRGEAAAFQVRR